MSIQTTHKAIEILLVEDSAADIRLTQEAFKEGLVKNKLHIVKDGMAALAFLHQEGVYTEAPRPNIILLDLNLPKKNGTEVLAEIKSDDRLKHIPVVILTTSDAPVDIVNAYARHANAYIKKPVDLKQFLHVIQTVEQFWLKVVQLPEMQFKA